MLGFAGWKGVKLKFSLIFYLQNRSSKVTSWRK
jgi:hypothetical protein